MTRPQVSRRSCLAVPGSSQRFLDKARSLNADHVLLGLEDSVADEATRKLALAAATRGRAASLTRNARRRPGSRHAPAGCLNHAKSGQYPL